MKQTQNGSTESPRLAMTAKMLGAITFWTGFPVLLIIAALITQSFLQNPFVIVVETIVIFCIYLAVRAHFIREDGDEDKDYLRNHLMCLVTGAVVLRLTYNANHHLNPWGTIGWAILIGVLVLILGLGLVAERKEQNTWKDTLGSMDGWRPITAFLLIALGAQQTYLHWATPWVWVPIGMAWLFLFTTTSPDCSWNGSDERRTATAPFTLVLIAIGLVSLIWQFGHPIVEGLGNASMATLSFLDGFVNVVIVDFWPCWIVVLIVAVGIWIAVRQRNIRNKKIEAKLAEERIAKQDEERKQNEIKRKEREEEQKQKDLKELTNLTATISSTETPDWKDIRKWRSLVRNLGLPENCPVDHHKIMTTSLLPLFLHSKEKNQIAYNGGLFKDVLSLLEETIQYSFDDEILAAIKKNLKDLKVFEGTIGYEDVVRSMRYQDRVRAFFEDEVKQEVA